MAGGRAACLCQVLVVTKQAEGRDSSREREKGHKVLRVIHGQGKMRAFRRGLKPSKVKGTEGCPSSGSKGRVSQVSSPCSARHPHCHPLIQCCRRGLVAQRRQAACPGPHSLRVGMGVV